MEEALYTLVASTSTGRVTVKLRALTDNSASFLAYKELKELGYKSVVIVMQVRESRV
jgi:hypothetical protein